MTNVRNEFIKIPIELRGTSTCLDGMLQEYAKNPDDIKKSLQEMEKEEQVPDLINEIKRVSETFDYTLDLPVAYVLAELAQHINAILLYLIHIQYLVHEQKKEEGYLVTIEWLLDQGEFIVEYKNLEMLMELGNSFVAEHSVLKN